MSDKNNAHKVAKRDSKGRFVKGTCGGGRTKGAANHLLSLARETALELWPDLVNQAKEGDPDAIRLIMQLGVPKGKPISEKEPLALDSGLSATDLGRRILDAALSGEISRDAANEYIGMLGSIGRIEEIENIKEEIAALKRALQRR